MSERLVPYKRISVFIYVFTGYTHRLVRSVSVVYVPALRPPTDWLSSVTYTWSRDFVTLTTCSYTGRPILPVRPWVTTESGMRLLVSFGKPSKNSFLIALSWLKNCPNETTTRLLSDSPSLTFQQKFELLPLSVGPPLLIRRLLRPQVPSRGSYKDRAKQMSVPFRCTDLQRGKGGTH